MCLLIDIDERQKGICPSIYSSCYIGLSSNSFKYVIILSGYWYDSIA